MSSMEINEKLEELYSMYAYRVFRHHEMPVAQRDEPSVMSFEMMDDKIVSVFYCQGLAERIEVVEFGAQENPEKYCHVYHLNSIPWEYEGVYSRLKTTFPQREELTNLSEIILM